jgi:hypothetical protein
MLRGEGHLQICFHYYYYYYYIHHQQPPPLKQKLTGHIARTKECIQNFGCDYSEEGLAPGSPPVVWVTPNLWNDPTFENSSKMERDIRSNP